MTGELTAAYEVGELARSLHVERIGCEAHSGSASADEVASVHREQARRLAFATLDTAPKEALPHPGENHEFRTTCKRCGEPGFLHVALIAPDETFVIQPAHPLHEEPADE